MLSSCLALPRERYRLQLFHMFSYLEKQHNCEMVFDCTVPTINKADFLKENWDNIVYSNERGKLKEEIPTSLPTSLGKVSLCVCILIQTMQEIKLQEDLGLERLRSHHLVVSS